MTLLGSTFLIYFVIGAGVAVAVYVSDMARTPAERGFQTAVCVVFWPLFLPLLLQQRQAQHFAPSEILAAADELACAIHQVETELHSALRTTKPMPGDEARLARLRSRWMAQAARIREMDRLLASPQYAAPIDAIQAGKPSLRDGSQQADRLSGGSDAMCALVERLRQVRQQAHDELMAALSKAREAAAMLHLAHFSGAPCAHRADLIAEIDTISRDVEDITDRDPSLRAPYI
jgi:hypothetical protein